MLIHFYWANTNPELTIRPTPTDIDNCGIPGKLYLNLKKWANNLSTTHFMPVLWVNDTLFQFLIRHNKSRAYERKWLRESWHLEADKFLQRLNIPDRDYAVLAYLPMIVINVEAYFSEKRMLRYLKYYRLFNEYNLTAIIKDFASLLFTAHFGGIYLDMDMQATDRSFPQDESYFTQFLEQENFHADVVAKLKAINIRKKLPTTTVPIFTQTRSLTTKESQFPLHKGDFGLLFSLNANDYDDAAYQKYETNDARDEKLITQFRKAMQQYDRLLQSHHESFLPYQQLTNPTKERELWQQLYRDNPIATAGLLKTLSVYISNKHVILSYFNANFPQYAASLKYIRLLNSFLKNKEANPYFALHQIEEYHNVFELMMKMTGALINMEVMHRVPESTLLKIYQTHIFPLMFGPLLKATHVEEPSSTFYTGYGQLVSENWAFDTLTKHHFVQKYRQHKPELIAKWQAQKASKLM